MVKDSLRTCFESSSQCKKNPATLSNELDAFLYFLLAAGPKICAALSRPSLGFHWLFPDGSSFCLVRCSAAALPPLPYPLPLPLGLPVAAAGAGIINLKASVILFT